MKIIQNNTQKVLEPKAGEIYVHTDMNGRLEYYLIASKTGYDANHNILLAYCLKDGLLWSSDSVFGGASEQFTKFNDSLTISN